MSAENISAIWIAIASGMRGFVGGREQRRRIVPLATRTWRAERGHLAVGARTGRRIALDRQAREVGAALLGVGRREARHQFQRPAIARPAPAPSCRGVPSSSAARVVVRAQESGRSRIVDAQAAQQRFGGVAGPSQVAARQLELMRRPSARSCAMQPGGSMASVIRRRGSWPASGASGAMPKAVTPKPASARAQRRQRACDGEQRVTRSARRRCERRESDGISEFNVGGAIGRAVDSAPSTAGACLG